MNIVRWFVALLLCAASPLHAVTINFLSDSRSVDTRATAGSSNGSATMPDAQIAAPFQTFSGGASSTMTWPDAVDPQFLNAAFASAGQTSALLPDGFSISTSLTAAVQGSARQTPRSQSKASATSQVAFTFTVSEPVMFELVYSEAHDS